MIISPPPPPPPPQIDHYNSLTTTGLARYPADNPAVEFDRLVTPEIISAARIRNSPGTLRLKWSSLLLPAFSGYVKVHEARYRYLKRVPNGQNYYVDVPVSSDSSPIPVSIAPNSTSAAIEITLGNLPNFVVGGELQLRIELRGNIGTQLPGEPDSLAWGHKDVWNSFGTVFLTAQQPTGIQAIPWLQVLQQSCWFAQEKSNEIDIRREITKGIFYETKKYSGEWRYFTSDSNGGDDQKLNLTSYFSPITLHMDCRDGASLTVAFCESLGLTTSILFYYEPIDKTNPICGAGYNSNDYSEYNVLDFNFHAVAIDGTYQIYDSVAAFWVDLSGNPWKNPVWNWTPYGYPQTTVGFPLPAPPFPAQPQNFYGLVDSPLGYDYQNSSLRDVIEIQ